jgi:hypothetical protein
MRGLAGTVAVGRSLQLQHWRCAVGNLSAEAAVLDCGRSWLLRGGMLPHACAAFTPLQACLSSCHALLQGMPGSRDCDGGVCVVLWQHLASVGCLWGMLCVCVCVCLSACCELLVMVVGPLVMLSALLYQCMHPFMLWS